MTTTIFSQLLDVIAQFVAVMYPPVFVFWLVVHSNIGYWRRLGNRAYWIACLAWPVCGIPILLFRGAIFSNRFPTPWWTIMMGVLALGLAIRFGWLASRIISRRTLVGIPELEPHKNTQPILQTGIYARTRNPIYLTHSLVIVALAMLTGYAANWALLGLDLVLLPVMVRAEERELIGRYGDAYRHYMRMVPRFVPRWPW